MESFLTPEVKRVALSLMEGLDCARSLTAAILLRYDEYGQLVKLSTDPRHHLDADSYFRSASADSFLRKLESDLPGVDRAFATIETWRKSELQCYRSNQRIGEIIDFGTLQGVPCDERILNFFSDAKKFCRWFIGSPPQLVEGVFGPGATVSDTSRQVTLGNKMSSTPTFTTSALFHLVPWTGTAWAKACAMRLDGPVSVPGNVFFQVPKTSLINRPCAKEPSLNGFWQRGYGKVLASRLLNRGISVVDAKGIHMRVACDASVSGKMATIDLSSASDTMCSALVEALLPHDWFTVLDDLRSKRTLIEGKYQMLEKFSSMGNGFTFELETIVFLSICLAVAPWLTPGVDLYVFGDDIIVPTDVADDVIGALRFCGFSLNEAKSFVEGPFRESCGGDYFQGFDVRPYFLKELPHAAQDYMALANGIYALKERSGRLRSACTPGLRRAWFRATDLVALPARDCRGPVELGDIVIHDEPSKWRVRWRNCIRYVRTYRPVRRSIVRWDRFDGDVQLACAVYGCSLSLPSGRVVTARNVHLEGFVPRDGVSGYGRGWAAFS